jgi:predicted PurR-regulated permease PerM
MQKSTYDFFKQGTYVLLFFVLLGGILYFAKPFIVPFTIAGLLAMLLFPVTERLMKWGINESVSIVMSILLAAIVLAGLVLLLGHQISNFADQLPLIKQKAAEKLDALKQYMDQHTSLEPDKTMQSAKTYINKSTSAGSGMLKSAFSATTGFLAGFVVLPIYTFFFQFYRKKLKVFLYGLFPPELQQEALKMIDETTKVASGYLRGMLIVISLLAVMNISGLLILGVKNAIFLGVFAAILDLIPYIGVLMGYAFCFLVAMVTGSTSQALGVIVLAVIAQFMENNVFQPRITGSQVNANSFATLLSIVAGGLIWGVAGMVLFIPLLGIFKVAAEHLEPLRPLAYLIGQDKISGRPNVLIRLWQKIRGKSGQEGKSS